MSSYEPSGKDIKLINHFTPITSNAFYNRKQVIQNEHTFFSENKSQIELRNINLLNYYNSKASKSLSDLVYVQIIKPVFQNSVLNKAFNSYLSETKMKCSFSHSYIDTKAKQKSRNNQKIKNYVNITSKRIYCIKEKILKNNFDNRSVYSSFRGRWYKDTTPKVRSIFKSKTRNEMNICPNIDINTVH